MPDLEQSLVIYDIPNGLRGTRINVTSAIPNEFDILIPQGAHKVEIRKLKEDGIGLYFIDGKDNYLGDPKIPFTSFYRHMECAVFVEKIGAILSSARQPAQNQPIQRQ